MRPDVMPDGEDVAMAYVGIDLAWGTRARTGLAVVDEAGALVASSSAIRDDDIHAWLAAHAPAPTVVAVDAPLIVRNDTGSRASEKLITAAYGRYGAGTHPSNRGRPYFDPPRGGELAARQGWTLDPEADPAAGTAVCLEVYPHAAMVGLFGLGYRLPYKKGPLASRQAALTELLGLLCGLEVLRLGGNERWAEIEEQVADSARLVDLDAVEDEVDAVLCAHLAWLWRRQRSALKVFGDWHDGAIVAPPRPTHPAARPARSPEPSTTASPDSIADLTAAVRRSADARDWHRLHTPKDLAMALAGEAGELLAELQWLDGEESRTAVVEDEALRGRIGLEMAGVLLYLVRLADVSGIDLLDAARRRSEINGARRPLSGGDRGIPPAAP